MDNKNGMLKKYTFLTCAAAAVTAAMWFAVWRTDYDMSLGVFDSGIFGTVATVVTIILAIVLSLPYFTGDKNAKAPGTLTDSPTGAGAAGAFLAGCFALLSGIIPVIEKNTGALSLIAAALSVPAAAYFIAVSVSSGKGGKTLGWLVFFPVLWGVAEVLFNYFSVTRAINDPKKIFLEFIPIAIMLFVLCEARTRHGDCLKGAFAACSGLAVLIGAVGLSMAADELTGIVLRLLSKAGVSVSIDILASSANYAELSMGACGAACAVYAFTRLRRAARLHEEGADSAGTPTPADKSEENDLVE